jgi:Xaa-Pro dipeptidase
MTKPSIHFTYEEFSERHAKTRQRMAELGLDGLLLFKIEDQYWLSGYQSDGFCIFGCMYFGADGAMTHLARPADLGNVDYSSICSDVRVAYDDENISRASQVKDMLTAYGMAGKRIGIQVDTMGLTPRNYNDIKAALDGWCKLSDAPDFIRGLRMIKSEAELGYFRKAGGIMDQVFANVTDATHAGAYEGDIYATFYDTLFRAGADLPAHIPPFGSGTSALNLRYTSARKNVLENDQVCLELGLAYRRYHVACMGVVLTGPQINDRHLKMHAASVDALGAVQAILRPGTTVGELYDAYKTTLEEAGEHNSVLTVAGYTMGAMWPPTWMEQPLIFAGNPTVIQENMVFFTHMIMNDYETGLTMAVGETAIVTSGAPEIITHAPKEPIIKA